MKQKVTVRALVKQDGKVLLIKRAAGNETLRGKFELPGGKLEYGEQPIEALKREVKEELGVDVETTQLYDTVTHLETGGSNLQRVVIVYSVSLAPHTRVITLSEEHSKYTWKKLSEIQLDELTQSAQLVLGGSFSDGTESVNSEVRAIKEDEITSTNRLIVYSDGGSRGNPGPSAAGFVVMDQHEVVLEEGGKYLGITTNNLAEYQAVYLGLERAKQMGARVVDFRMDSLLVVNQLTGIYQVKNRELWPVHARIKSLTESFDKVTFRHVKREFNKLADGMVNKVLDQHVLTQPTP